MIEGPFLVGSAFRRNQQPNTPITFAPVTAVPAGAFLVAVLGSSAPDSEPITITDSAGNVYQMNVASQKPGTPLTCVVQLCYEPSLPVPLSGQISMVCGVRCDFGGAVYYFTGAQNYLYSRTIEWGETATPSAIVPVRAGMSSFATLAVAGPDNDVFTQDPNGWSQDIKTGLNTINVTIHATAKHGLAEGNVTYAPTLGSARQSTLCLFGFQ